MFDIERKLNSTCFRFQILCTAKDVIKHIFSTLLIFLPLSATIRLKKLKTCLHEAKATYENTFPALNHYKKYLIQVFLFAKGFWRIRRQCYAMAPELPFNTPFFKPQTEQELLSSVNAAAKELGLLPNVTITEANKRLRELVLEYHPDKSEDGSNIKFVRFNQVKERVLEVIKN